MKKHKVALIIGLLLSVVLVQADFNIFLEGGNNNGFTNTVRGNGGSTFITKLPNVPGVGMISEPVVGDLDADGTMEIIVYAGDNIISFRNGFTPNTEISAVNVGEPEVTPTICDIDNDGELEYVGVFQNGTTNLVSMSLDGVQITKEAEVELANDTNIYGKIACSKFFVTEGDNKNYILFTDNSRFLHIARVDNGVWVDQVLNIQTAVQKEIAEPFPWPRKYGPVVSTTFNAGTTSVAYVAGRFLITYSSDGDGESIDLSTELDNGDTCAVHVKSLPQASGPDRIVVGTGRTSILCTLDGPGNGAKFLKIRNIDGTLFQEGVTVDLGLSGGTGFSVAYATGPWNDDGTFDVVASSNNLGFTPNFRFRVWDGGNFSLIKDASSTVICDESEGRRMYLVNMDGDGDLDALFMCQNATGLSDRMFYGQNTNSSTFITLFIDELPRPATPIPVDFNQDGFLDLVYSAPGGTRFYQTSAISETVANFPFNVTIDDVTGFVATQNITALFNSINDVYNYGAVCNIQSNSIWTETFNFAYNFSLRNVSLNTFPPESLLAPGGISFSVPNTTSFNLLKEHNEGTRDSMELSVSYQTSANSVLDVLVFADDNRITEIWRLNKTGLNLVVTEEVPGQGFLVVANTTLNSNFVRFSVLHEPTFEEFSGIESFDITISINDVVINTSVATAPFQGTNIKSVQLFTNTPANYTISQISLVEQTNVEPLLTQFSNGVRTVIDDITITVPSPNAPLIPGDGFDVIPDFNNQFFSTCTYETTGAFLQRHYIAPINTIDYTNFKEILVTIPTGALDSIPIVEGGFAGDPLLEGFIDILPDSLQGPLGRFLVWLLLAFLLIVIGFAVSEILGVLAVPVALLLGVLTGALPLWVALLLAIVAFGAVALVFRKVFAGGG